MCALGHRTYIYIYVYVYQPKHIACIITYHIMPMVTSQELTGSGMMNVVDLAIQLHICICFINVCFYVSSNKINFNSCQHKLAFPILDRCKV